MDRSVAVTELCGDGGGGSLELMFRARDRGKLLFWRQR